MNLNVHIKRLIALGLCVLCLNSQGQETTGPDATSSAVSVDRIVIPVGRQTGDRVDLALPQKGLNQAQVREQFGNPLQQTPPRGQPPISSWRYGEFVVYFEGNTVIHSVVLHHTQADAGDK